MSDFTSHKKKELFNALEHTKEICNGGLVILSTYISVDYKVGWTDLVEDMLIKIKNTDVHLISISSDYGQLEVQFEPSSKVHELKVWRVINVAKLRSRRICIECGDTGYRQIHNEKLAILCKDCATGIAASGKTGTWLDRY